MNNKYCVYVHIVPNDKKYYGMTKNVKNRWKNGCGYKERNPEFYNDIITYGWDNIKHIIIADNLIKEEAELLEEQLILENRTYDSNYGYNKYIGNKYTDEQKEAKSKSMSGVNNHMHGKTHSEEAKTKMSEAHKGHIVSDETKAKLSESHKGKVLSDETKNKISKANSGANHHMYGKHFSEETKAKMSEAKKGENNNMYGKHHTEEAKAKISKANKGKYTGANNPNAQKVICITTMVVFDTIKDAADYYNIGYNHICCCCRGKRKSAGKFNNQKLAWRYLYTKIL